MDYKLYPCKLRVMGHGFNGFSRILRIGSWENISPFSDLRGQNPRHLRKSAKSVSGLHIFASYVCRRAVVGDGFIRPEVA
ncbi:MAG: hypothetical protein FWG87_04015 [Defluviitaleaceae bacterium]|nr:hypothetical protein [Defluviitaleaceae bacterium]